MLHSIPLIISINILRFENSIKSYVLYHFEKAAKPLKLLKIQLLNNIYNHDLKQQCMYSFNHLTQRKMSSDNYVV